MKIINIKLVFAALALLGLSTVAQARIDYRINFGSIADSVLNYGSPALGNKYCSDANSPLTDAEIDQIIQIHNQVRADVGAGQLKWNCDLAKFSQNWANTDTYEHSTEQQRGQIITGGVAGENLSLDSDTTAAMSALHKGWINEKSGWNNDSNTCSKEPCGHYTQMVWSKSQMVGCGVFRNSKKMGEAFPNSSYFVCTYYPGGNMAGEKPY